MENQPLDEATAEEIDFSSLVDFEHKMPLLLCLYFYIPAITIVIMRDWYDQKATLEMQYSRHTRYVAFFFTFALAVCLYYLSAFPYEHIFYNRLYLCSACYMSLFIILLSYGYKRRPDIRHGVMISYFGLVLSFITTAALYFYGDREMFHVMYNIGVVIFLLGNAAVFHISIS